MSNDTKVLCELCGEPMPDGETMFKYHGYSGRCPKPLLPRPVVPDPLAAMTADRDALAAQLVALREALTELLAAREAVTFGARNSAGRYAVAWAQAKDALAALDAKDAT